jgi:pyruvate dehydrogenase (quinone)
VELGLIGSVKDTLDALVPMLDEAQDSAFLDKCLSHYQEARKGLDDLASGIPGHTPMHPQYVAKIVDELASDDAVFTCDVGTPTIWAARYLRMNGKRRLIGSFIHGSMANALPQAIGAQASYPGRQVISLSGDGGLAMLLGEVAGMVDYGTELVNPNFAQLAEAAGIFGVRVDKPEELRSAVLRAFEHDGPALIEVMVNRQELSMPPSISAQQAMGFGLYVVRAVLSGRGDEVIDLASSNLFR